MPVLLPALWLLALAGGVSAQPMPLPQNTPYIYLWGVRQGCQIHEGSQRAIERHLYEMGLTVVGLDHGKVQHPLYQECQAAGCADLFRAKCPVHGRLLGGEMEQRGSGPNGSLYVMRLWMVELETRRMATREQHCQGCDPAEMAALLAGDLLERGVLRAGEPPASGRPGSCESAAPVPVSASTPLIVDPDKVLLATCGKREHRAQRLLARAVGEAIRLTGRDVGPVSLDRCDLDVASLPRAQQDHSGPLLSLELPGSGQIVIRLQSAPGQKTQRVQIECQHTCDEEGAVQRAVLEAGALLDRAALPRCQQEGGCARFRGEPPPRACEPLLPPVCRREAGALAPPVLPANLDVCGRRPPVPKPRGAPRGATGASPGRVRVVATLGAVGLGLSVGGGVLLGMGGRPTDGMCDYLGEMVNGPGRCQQSYQVPGAVLLGAGLASLTVSAILGVVFFRKREEAERSKHGR